MRKWGNIIGEGGIRMGDMGKQEFQDRALALKFAQEKVAESWVTHFYERNRGGLRSVWVVHWWCQ